METKPRLIPLLPLRGMLVFPGMIINLDVGRERSIRAVEAAMTSDKQILLVSQKEAGTLEPGQTDLFKYGADNRFSVFVNQGTNTPASSKLCHKVIDPGFSVHYHIKAFHTSCSFSNFKSSASHIDTSQ